MTDASAIPAELRALPQWIRWKSVPATPKPRKIPVRPSDPGCAASDDPETWGTFDDALANVGKHGTCGVGFVFSKEDDFFGVDLDECLTEEGQPTEAAAAEIARFSSYTEESPSGLGVHIIGRGSLNGHRGMNRKGVEVYGEGRYFTMTGKVLPGAPTVLAECQSALDDLVTRLDPPPAARPPSVARPKRATSPGRLLERARAYADRMPAAISGQGGHDATFRVALALVKGFSLDAGSALDVLRDYNGRCDPPWSERDLLHKVDDALAADVPDGYILDRDEPARGPVSTVRNSEPDATPSPVVRKSLVDVVRGIKRRNPFSLGLPHLDAMLGGGLSVGESLVLGGGPGTIKTTTEAVAIRALAGPRTAIFGIFFDEHYERVCRKIAARFGLRYEETEEPSEAVMAFLTAELARLDAHFEIVSPETDPTVEEIIEDCLAATPDGRVPILVVDHIHRLRSGATGDRDNPSAGVGHVVNALMRATARGAIVFALSEVTKAATNPEVVRANPAGVFADSRAILSRFDVGLATVKIQAPGDSHEVLAEIIGTGKNRFGSGQGGYVAALNLETWSITTRDSEAVSAEAEERSRAAKGKAKRDTMQADELAVLSYIVAHAAAQEVGMRRRDVVKGLPATGAGVSENRTDQALIRLKGASRIEEYATRTPGVTKGPEPVFVRILPEENPS